MLKSFKYRLYPTRNQRETLQFTLNHNRELYNAALEERREAWHMSRVSVNFEMQSAQLPEIKELRPEYNEIYAQVLQDTLHRVDKAFKNFFRRVKKGEKAGYPAFKGITAITPSRTPRLKDSSKNQRFVLKTGVWFCPRSAISR